MAWTWCHIPQGSHVWQKVQQRMAEVPSACGRLSQRPTLPFGRWALVQGRNNPRMAWLCWHSKNTSECLGCLFLFALPRGYIWGKLKSDEDLTQFKAAQSRHQHGFLTTGTPWDPMVWHWSRYQKDMGALKRKGWWFGDGSNLASCKSVWLIQWFQEMSVGCWCIGIGSSIIHVVSNKWATPNTSTVQIYMYIYNLQQFSYVSQFPLWAQTFFLILRLSI